MNSTHVITKDTPYYTNSPQQDSPPEGELTAGTQVRMVSEHGSYAQVEREEGTIVYVANLDLRTVTSTTFTVNKDVPILVEFTPQPGLKQTSRISPDNIAEKSMQAISNAMSAIYQMAQHTQGVIRALPVPERPSELEVEFNIKLTTEAGVLLAKAGAESTLHVKLIWKHDEPKQN
jgi:hypothetical protein